ncbi:nucleotidyltransferase domain-containing protein [Caryophanon latum]|uniref:Polymerase nucleotidyl transferase domain-containing protein n=1 Tax=Caryophanon latum TaxID=33977 RepID=A0A1C0YQ39_9BACL|nr:nucleotidyltransferase domain-containing protein [Caryophanon latum]OCS89273.1 hypothetical protein A6K76_13070 [Caryophanon latum]
MDKWLQQLKGVLLNEFGESIQFIGLQGSRARNEATDRSDIDVVVIFDAMTMDVLARYEAVVQTLPNRHLLCGFVGGLNDLNNWDKADLFTFMYDTTAIYGELSIPKEAITKAHVQKFVRSTAGNVYHMALHNYLHGKDIHTIVSLFKSARFAVQGIVFLEKATFIAQLSQLETVATHYDRDVIQRLATLINSADADLQKDTELLLAWSQHVLQRVKE